MPTRNPHYTMVSDPSNGRYQLVPLLPDPVGTPAEQESFRKGLEYAARTLSDRAKFTQLRLEHLEGSGNIPADVRDSLKASLGESLAGDLQSAALIANLSLPEIVTRETTVNVTVNVPESLLRECRAVCGDLPHTERLIARINAALGTMKAGGQL